MLFKYDRVRFFIFFSFLEQRNVVTISTTVHFVSSFQLYCEVKCQSKVEEHLAPVSSNQEGFSEFLPYGGNLQYCVCDMKLGFFLQDKLINGQSSKKS